MSSTNDTSAIDEKKDSGTNKNKTNTPSNYLNYFLAVLKLVAFILLDILIGSGILYACKVATANVLPSDLNCDQYSEINVAPIDVDVDINKVGDKVYSTKINFPYNKHGDTLIDKIADYNRSNFIIDWLEKQKKVPDSWAIKMYFISVLENLFMMNYSIINSILHFMNKNFYEFVILLFGPFILLFLSGFISLFSFFYSIYLWFVNFNWMFKENTNTDSKRAPKWEDVTFLNAYNFGISCFVGFWLFIGLLLFYIFGFAAVSSMTTIIFFMCLISAILMKSVIADGENEGQSYRLSKTFKDLLVSNMRNLMILITILMILLTFSFFGSTGGIVSIVLYIILFFGIVGNHLYSNSTPPTDSTPGLINPEVNLATKKCIKKEVGIAALSGGEGNKLLRQLKQLSKELAK